MGNNASIKRESGAAEGQGGSDLVVGSPMEESGFVFPGHQHDLLHDEAAGLKQTHIMHSGGVAKVPAVFRWKGGGKEVFLAGSYDQWKARIPLSRSRDDFYGIVDLPAGEHEYKFMVDGQWKTNQDEPTKLNAEGIMNNVLEVKDSDFEVFEALARDSSSLENVRDITHSPPGSYNQDIPREMLEDSNVHPPTLPPHLLNKVLLNQDVDLACEPSLLPEPQHVMLNHMYALSIKDGVMALSATHRYKKKFVTTLLYKPI
ncbi:5'-AMP-activated protein kinase subunit beta-1-like [Styela clava]|uniref:5'-AMP-activated protein kinase subunit beta-1-like n=1 Tax=Styela clava TaxID=7725 RepID=UPI00193A3A24|nr:5'-AMP-activated protein kinase subunit beta-1-like [Styela clava]